MKKKDRRWIVETIRTEGLILANRMNVGPPGPQGAMGVTGFPGVSEDKADALIEAIDALNRRLDEMQERR